MFYIFPWLRWDGRQAVLFDLPARKFYVFGLTFWPQDFLFLAMLLIIAAIALFFFTALAGRLFCGYACPQTVWTEVSLWIEQWIEGDRNKRIKLDAEPWGMRKVLRKGTRHLVWILFSLWTGFTFVGFFSPITDLASRIWPFAWGGWETFWVFFYGFATWGNAGFLREQVCKYMCPYARFQSAMFDRNTLIISYDPMRGEPRGPRKRGSLSSALERVRGLLDFETAESYVLRANLNPTAAGDQVNAKRTITWDASKKEQEELTPLPSFKPEELGDCIDCTICVQVCPTGIDIRSGLQYECIACGACIDACDGVMDKMGYPRGLIRYSTQNSIDGKSTRVLRPRVFVYGMILVAFIVAWGVGVTNRSPMSAEILRDRNALYRPAGDFLENDYTLKLINKTEKPQTFIVEIVSDVPGIELQERSRQPITANPQQILSLPLTVVAPADIRGRHKIAFVVRNADGSVEKTVDSSFFGPLQ
ncbi:MAG: 4Fe-4S binding protein [Xanthomonadaceae bacterium]|nr:4Fe-4S binding protein [Xanthomonadaceae bacterium]